ncbi:MAG: rod shape-determining protein RodA [Candidatus Marinimicrobia bacterium CG08_land_8_20_14_0_20_45_22]|nr:MAG: rod shape-determining protein RodA [Candidatus Marinimicrobia bacterium CG08_land_8_20_14_0_20_45_22]
METRKFNLAKDFTKTLSDNNRILIIIVGLLSLIGLLSLFSASMRIDLPFFQKVIGRQLIWMLSGILLMTLIFFLQGKLFFDTAYFIYSIGIVLVILPFFLGRASSGAYRWIGFGGLRFQPSEFMKLIVILSIAKYLCRTDLPITQFKSLVPPLMLGLLPMVIVMSQPDLGTSLVYFAVIFPMLIWAGARTFHIFILLSPILSVVTAFNFYTFFIWVILLIAVFYITREKLWISIILFVLNLSLGFMTPILWNHLKPYQQNRILTLFNIEADPQGAGYQVLQSQITIGSGGIFGKGLGKGTQTHLKFLPEQHNDFIFSVVGEEYGFIGTVIVLILFLLMIFVFINSAFRLKDRFGSLIIIGVGSMLFFHIAVNIAMTIGFMPVTGIPLPFLSYGGSFAITCFAAIGMVLNVSTEKPIGRHRL